MSLIDIVLPRRCTFCQKPGSPGMCDDCRRTLPWVTEQESGCLAPLVYKDSVRSALIRLKFSSSAYAADTFGVLMARCFLASGKRKPDAVTWVPSSFLRKRKRGYDQARLLAKAVSKELGIPLRGYIKKTRHTVSQSRLGGLERRENVSGAFKIVRNAEGKRLLLIDDIKTTGATLEECGKLLTQAGASGVELLVAAVNKRHWSNAPERAGAGTNYGRIDKGG